MMGTRNATIQGGHRADFWKRNPKGSEIRRWPTNDAPPSPEDPRGVSVKISSWVGTSVGARHTYLEITEDHNPMWDTDEDAWRIMWDDAEGKGRHMKAEVMTESEAVALAVSYMRLLHYGSKSWRVRYDTSMGTEKVIKNHIKE